MVGAGQRRRGAAPGRLPCRRAHLSIARPGSGPDGQGAARRQSIRPDLQPRAPEHCTLAAAHDYISAMPKAEARPRALQHSYPPYQRLARLVIRSKEQEAARGICRSPGSRLRPGHGSRPAAASCRGGGVTHPRPRRGSRCFRLKGYYRFHFQLQSPSSAFLHQVLRLVVPTVRLPHEVDLT